MARTSRKAVVWGAGGFTGGELLRLLVTHPEFELVAALSATNPGKAIGDVYPNLAPCTKLRFTAPADFSWDTLKKGPWALFSAQAHKETMKLLPPVLASLSGADVKVIDLSGDFRLSDPAVYRKYYGEEHLSPELLARFVYGLPELHKKAIVGADWIANPGCFATCAQLAILPMAGWKKRASFVAIDAKTGSSGAGVKPTSTTHHPNRMNNFRAYKLLGHQHVPEIENGWTGAGGNAETPITFVPQMAPIVRGIFTSAHFFLETETGAEEVRELYARYYEGAPFVRLVGESPSVSDVWGTNRCDIGVVADGRKVVVTAAIDNLVKGASGQAVQNANLVSGFEETAGLLAPAPSPV